MQPKLKFNFNTKHIRTVEFVNSLVDVMYDLHDNLDFPFGAQKNAIHYIVPIGFRGIHPRDDIHLG